MNDIRLILLHTIEALHHHTAMTRPIQQTEDAIAELCKVIDDIEPISNEARKAGMRFCCGRDERRVLEIAALRNVVQAAFIDGSVKAIETWNHHFPDDQREVPTNPKSAAPECEQ